MTDAHNGSDQPGNPAPMAMYFGPYEAWNFGAGLDYALPIMRKYLRYMSALAELGVVQDGDLQSIDHDVWLPTLWGDPRKLTFIPFVIKNPFETLPEGGSLHHLASHLREGFAFAMSRFGLDAQTPGTAGPLFDRVKSSRFRIAFPVADGAMHADAGAGPQPPDWAPEQGLRERIGPDKRITVLAVIDDGLPFAHRNFRDAGGTRTRVEFCWLQSVAVDTNQKSVLFGREYTREQIDDYIAQHGDDEDALYREAGATADTEELGSLIDRHATHGAHVMDLATGYARERHETPPEEIRIIAVQLPNTIAWDTSGFGKDMYMLSAFHYIFDRADVIAKGYDVKDLRLVINFSYGFSGGRHDGQTELEAAINELMQKRRERKRDEHPLLGPSPTALVVPSGNTFLDRLHGLILPEDLVHDAAKFHWRIQPNDRTPSYLELWFWQGFDPHGYRIELQDPWGHVRASFDIAIETAPQGGDPNRMGSILNDLREQIGQISVDMHRDDARNRKGATGRWRVLIVLAPTEPADACLPRAWAGKWTVTVKRCEGGRLLEHSIHCWIQRSTDPESLRSGSRQSYFDDCAYEDGRFTPQGDLVETDDDKVFVQRFGSLNGLATGGTSLVVGGYRLGAGLGSSLACARPARYSSAGTRQSRWPAKQVACSSMSDRSRVLPGTIAAGVRSGSLSLVQGTSVAAPFVARQLIETFVTAEDAVVQPAERDNYVALLRGYEPETGTGPSPPAGNDSGCRKEDPELIKARLGAVLVPPHWQPAIEPPACGQDE